MKDEARGWLNGRTARGYLRVSSKAQGDKYGPTAQRADEDKAVHDLRMRAIDVYYEDHITGRDALKRSDFQRMVADAKASAFEVLVVGRVDRFARNEEDAWAYLKTLRLAGIAVYFCEEDVLVPHDEGWQDRVGAAINEAAAYSRKLSKNVRKGLRAKSASGAHIGGVAFGYRHGPDGKLEPDPATAPTRALAFELYTGPGEATYESVADDLNRRGRRFMSGRTFSASTVGEIIRNPIAVGFVRRRVGRVDETSERDAIAPIVTPEVWDAAQRRVAAQTSARMKPGQRRRTYLFSSIARCADCGETFWGRTVHQPNGRPPVAQLLHAPRGCGRRGTRNEAAISRRVGAWLAGWQLDAKTKTQIADYMNREQQDTETDAQRKTLETRLRQLAKQHEWAAISDNDFLAGRGRMLRALEELPTAPAARAPTTEALALAERIGEVWDASTPEQRAAFMREWFDEMRIGGDGAIEIRAREAYFPIVAAAVGGSKDAALWALLGSTRQ